MSFSQAKNTILGSTETAPGTGFAFTGSDDSKNQRFPVNEDGTI
ncbi:MAG: hypothetical protein P8K66_07545 [Planctomycetota bacterium]|nr:hypothetical protein [Planctomycetota bacterium]